MVCARAVRGPVVWDAEHFRWTRVRGEWHAGSWGLLVLGCTAVGPGVTGSAMDYDVLEASLEAGQSGTDRRDPSYLRMLFGRELGCIRRDIERSGHRWSPFPSRVRPLRLYRPAQPLRRSLRLLLRNCQSPAPLARVDEQDRRLEER